MKNGRQFWVLAFLILLSLVYLFWRRGNEPDALNRDVSRIIYTRHAKCRMDCRNIDSSEVSEILRDGDVNYQKSDLRSSPDPKFALEGNTHDGQHVRIVFANSARGPVVITVIDLEKEWNCDCK